MIFFLKLNMAVTFIQSGIGNSDLCKRSIERQSVAVFNRTDNGGDTLTIKSHQLGDHVEVGGEFQAQVAGSPEFESVHTIPNAAAISFP
jgi:hypothetical protein